MLNTLQELVGVRVLVYLKFFVLEHLLKSIVLHQFINCS
jgi:hypothetical protein